MRLPHENVVQVFARLVIETLLRYLLATLTTMFLEYWRTYLLGARAGGAGELTMSFMPVSIAGTSADEAPARCSIDSAGFRRALSRLAAGVSIITTVDRDGFKLGLTATSVTSVSLDPPLILACIDNRSRTIAPLTAGRPFVVHFLAANQESLARRFASFMIDKFVGLDYSMTASGCPRLAGVLANVECVADQIYPGGDHMIFVGRVIDTQIGDPVAHPLLYFAGHYLEGGCS
jgi:flavin reductase (DIM6/NTAB) family NADH-FMN oxidoreductase RutF